MRGRDLDPAWYAIKAKRCVNKPPLTPRLEREPQLPCPKWLGGGSVKGGR